MAIQLRFLGAARSVTGSRTLIQTSHARVLVDCGLYQEREFRNRDFEPFPIPAKSIDAVVLTHAHLDHCGLLPKLVKEGFRGSIYASQATCEIAPVVMEDSGVLQEEDARQKNKRHQKQGREGLVAPLYTKDDAVAVRRRFRAMGLEKPLEIARGITLTLQEAGHILGSTSCKLDITDDNEQRSIVFSGDLGGPGRPILHDPKPFSHADYIVVESTYGDRLHEGAEQVEERLRDVINWTAEKGGNILIPSFAIERAQEVLYRLNRLFKTKQIPALTVFLDSPMAVRVTEIFRHHSELYDEEMRDVLDSGGSPFSFSGLRFCTSRRESQAVNQIRGTAIIIAGAGMCTGGRIKHHLLHNIERPECSVLFVGYQASGTLGRELVEGAKRVRILGQSEVAVRAKIEQIQGFSGHADQHELMLWLSQQAKPRHLFVNHGGEHVSVKFANQVAQEYGWSTLAPEYGKIVQLS